MMKQLAALALILAASPALAASPEENRQGAAMVEWTVANCESGKIPAIMVAMTQMIVNGSGPEQMETYRQRMREGVKTHYPDTAAACADMLARIAATR